MPPSAVMVTSPVVLVDSSQVLTCDITLADMLDSGVQLQVVWTDSAGTVISGSTPTGAGTSYTSQVTLTNVKYSDAGSNYTCTASLTSSAAFMEASANVSNSTALTLQSKFTNLFSCNV